MATFTPASRLLGVVCVCVLVSAAEVQVNVRVGQNVTLTCRAPNISFIALKWTRPDLGGEYVLLNRDGHLDAANQHQSFKKRVDLQDRRMKDGDVSLILKDVIINDAGTYECWVFVNKTWKLINSTSLRVAPPPPGPTGGTTEDGSVGLIVGLSVAAVLLVAAVGFVIYRKHKDQQSQELNAPPAQTQMSLSSFQLNSEAPAALPLLSVVTEHRDTNDLEADSIQQHSTNTSDFTLTREEEPLHHPQQTAGQYQEAVTSLGDEHPVCDGLMEPEGRL